MNLGINGRTLGESFYQGLGGLDLCTRRQPSPEFRVGSATDKTQTRNLLITSQMLQPDQTSMWKGKTLPVDSHIGKTGIDRVWRVALQAIDYGGLCCLTIQVYHAIDTFRNVAGCCTLVQTIHKEVQCATVFTHYTHSVTNLAQNLNCLQQ